MLFKKIVVALSVIGSASSFAGGHGDHEGHDNEQSHEKSGSVVFGVDLLNYNLESDGLEIDIAVLRGTLGYKYSFNENLSIMPEVFAGGGIQDDTVNVLGVDIDNEIDSFYGFSIKGMYEFDEGLYGFVGPTYGKIDATASTDIGNGVRFSSSGSDSDWGVLGGIGFNFNKKWGAEFSYSDFGDDVIIAGFGLRFNLPN